MSGIVGFVSFDGPVADSDLLERMTNSLSYRGPDATGIWQKDNVGLGCTLLLIDPEHKNDQIPVTLDQQVWITADVRLDGRKQLITKLRAEFDKGKFASIGLPGDAHTDSELLLFSYHAWGEECVKHLIGDFAFAIWDTRSKSLFCAIDHMGVRQFYYAFKKKQFIFSNSLNTVRLHPLVSDVLNETAIGDFLLFALNQDVTTTTFADIQRLPRAHSLKVDVSGIRSSEYWTPTVKSELYTSDNDHVKRVRELLSEAVKDRLRTPSAGVLMSGGLDSSTVASLAKTGNGSTDLFACCSVYDQVFPDDERTYAGLTASKLNIPIEFLQADVINQTDNDRTLGFAPEPFNVDPIYAISDRLLSVVARRSRVALTGWDGDAFMLETPRFLFATLLKNRAYGQLLSNMVRYVRFQHTLPPIGVRTFWRRWRHPNWNTPLFPKWINPDFVKRLGLVDRFHSIYAEAKPAHPVRPNAIRMLSSPSWTALLNNYDSGVTRLPLEVRHPIVDIRVVQYLLALPVVPYLLDKRILRESSAGLLPEKVRLRAKTALARDPGVQLRYSNKFRAIDSFQAVPELLSFVNRGAVPPISGETDQHQLWINVRPFSLNQWLVNSR